MVKEWKIWELLYPRRCAICNRLLGARELDVCRECKKRVKCITGHVCLKCGKPIKGNKSLCRDCKSQKHLFEWGVSCYLYADVKEAVFRIKYAKREDLIPYFSSRMAEILKEDILQMQGDFFVPIPMHKSRQKKRGYNQAVLFAKELSFHMGIPMLERAVIRTKKTVPMKYLSLQQRQLNLKKAFIIGKNDVKLKTIILVDDIYTTGSTMDCVAKVLLDAGASAVYYITLAIGKETE